MEPTPQASIDQPNAVGKVPAILPEPLNAAGSPAAIEPPPDELAAAQQQIAELQAKVGDFERVAADQARSLEGKYAREQYISDTFGEGFPRELARMFLPETSDIEQLREGHHKMHSTIKSLLNFLVDERRIQWVNIGGDTIHAGGQSPANWTPPKSSIAPVAQISSVLRKKS